jgi:erythrocyte band 7 integral membrane protein
MTSTSTTDHTGNSGKAALNNDHALPNVEDSVVRVQPPRREDLQPSYAKVLKPDADDTNTHDWYASMIDTLGSVIGTFGAVPCCVCCPNPYRPVQQGTVGLISKFGRFARAVDPGLVRVNPLSERLIAIDVKTQIVGECSGSLCP